MSLLAEVFEEESALDRLEAFTSLNGPAFYRPGPERGAHHPDRKDAPVAYPAKIDTGAGPVTVFDPGFPLHWSVTA